MGKLDNFQDYERNGKQRLDHVNIFYCIEIKPEPGNVGGIYQWWQQVDLQTFFWSIADLSDYDVIMNEYLSR